MPAEILQSAGRAAESRFLAEAVCFRPNCSGTATDTEKKASDGGRCAAGVVRFREHLCYRHSGGFIHSMAPDCRNERLRKYHTRNRKAASWRHGAERTG